MVHALESTISEATEYKWKVTKDELLNAIRKEFVTMEVFEERMNTLRIDLEGKIENVRVGLGADIKRLDMKLGFMIVLMIIALTLMNTVMAEIIKGILDLK